LFPRWGGEPLEANPRVSPTSPALERRRERLRSLLLPCLPYFISGELLDSLMKTQALWKCIRGTFGTKRVGCGFWNVYQSKKDMSKTIYQPYRGVMHNSKTSPYSRSCKGSGWGDTRPRQVDTRCRHCNARVRFQLSQTRGDGRGRRRRVVLTLAAPKVPEGPITPLDEWTVQELLDLCNLRNRGEQVEQDNIRFTRAKNYRRR